DRGRPLGRRRGTRALARAPADRGRPSRLLRRCGAGPLVPRHRRGDRPARGHRRRSRRRHRSPRALRARVLTLARRLARRVLQRGEDRMSGLLAAGTFNPANEFELKQWVSIHLGPLDMSINKAVVYLAISALLTIALGLFTMRSRLALLPGKRQTIGEAVYELAETQVADGLPSKATGRWFPYVAS